MEESNEAEQDNKPAESSVSKKKAGKIALARQKLNHISQKALADEYDPGVTWKKNTLLSLRVLLASFRKFISDEAMLKATSISYSLIVSLIPMLVVALLVGAKTIDKNQYFQYGREFIKKNGIPIDPEPYFDIINILLMNANAITGAGFVILLFSATSVLRNLENAMNTIWKINKGRPWFQKIGGFLMVLVFGPALLTIGLSVANNFLDKASVPDIIKIEKFDGVLTAHGEKMLLFSQNNPKEHRWKQRSLIGSIDFENEKPPVVFHSESGTIMNDASIEYRKMNIEPSGKDEVKDSTINDSAETDTSIYLITDSGNIISKNKDNELWEIRSYRNIDINVIKKTRLKKIKMITNSFGLIIGDKGLILRTLDGKTWYPIYQKEIDQNLNDIIVFGKRIYVIGDTNTFIYSDDNGENWFQLQTLTTLIGDEKYNFHKIYRYGNELWVLASYGHYFVSPNGGGNWEIRDIGFNKEDLFDIGFINNEKGFIVGENAFVKYTLDHGKTWRGIGLDTKETLHTLYIDEENNRLLIAGTSRFIAETPIDDPGKFKIIEKVPFIFKLFTALGNIILPFIIIGLIFFLIYKTMPYTEVTNQAAATGASVTSVVWVIFLWFFKFYVSSFTKGTTYAIYGTLAAIPLSLLLVYISAAIILFGAEIGYFVQNPAAISGAIFGRRGIDKKFQIWNSLRILHLMYYNYEKGNGATQKKQLLKVFNNEENELQLVLENFLKRKVIEQTSEGKYTPVTDAKNILMKDLMDDVDPVTYSVPNYNEHNIFMRNIKKYFEKMDTGRKEIWGEVTLGDLLDKLA